MAERKRRLELTWIGKEERPRLEPRILLEDQELSYHAPKRVSEKDIFDNILIHGDNLLALKALEQDFAGKVKCIFIDPPYNTGKAFDQYDDRLEHSIWLSLIRDRIELLRALLSEEGTLWITIDDNECHYLKVLCDEIFGRANFVSSFAWEKDKSRRGDTDISSAHDHVLLYAKDRKIWRKLRNLFPRTERQNARYKNPDNDPRGPWLQGGSGTAKSGSDSFRYEITLPSGRVVTPPKGSYWRFSRNNFEQARSEGRVWFGRKGDSLPAIKRYLTQVQDGIVPRTWWPAEEAGSNQSAKRDHLRKLLPDIAPFATPKPEQLLRQILTISTNEGDLVLDSFAGSGTTGAVAHKMHRRWIMVELGDHCFTHLIPRLQKVVAGEDPMGITPELGWQGGGGFRTYRVAPPLLEKDKWGNWVVSKDYHPEMLAEAMCKLEGFHYQPDPDVFWIHGKSTESDFIYITTQNLSREQLQFISDQVGAERTLLICCAAFRAKRDEFPNLTVKKIPLAVLSRCEWGRDDYSLNVDSLPPVQVVEEQRAEPEPEANDEKKNGKTNGSKKTTTTRRRRKKASAMQELPLFAGLEDGGKSK